MTQIAKDTVVSLDYEIYDVDEELVEESHAEPLLYLHGGYDGIFPQVEEALHGKAVGDTVDVLMEPALAFGDYDESLVRVEDRASFPEKLEVGMSFESDEDENGESLIFTVSDIAADTVVLDGNHPLAGESLRFKGYVKAIRVAMPEELQHGHPHVPGEDHTH